MKAVRVTRLAGPDGVEIVEVPEPEPGAGVLVEVHAAALSFPDLLRSQGRYQERSEPPYTIGAELAGVVLGAPAGSGFAAGDRVAGLASGTAAERVVAQPSALLALPGSLDFAQGASLILNYETAIVSLEIRGRMRAGESVLVHGAAGGTGTAAIQVAHALGGRAIAVVSNQAKEDVARRAGADEVLRSDGPWKDGALGLTGGRGVDLVFDPVGGDRVLDTMRCLRPGGRWLVVGFVGGDIPQVPLNRVLLRNIDVVGAYWGGYVAALPEEGARIRARLLEMVGGGHIRPLVGTAYPMAEAARALRDLEGRRALGKVVLEIRAGP